MHKMKVCKKMKKTGTLVFEQTKKYDSLKLNYYELEEDKNEKQIFTINTKYKTKIKNLAQNKFFSLQ